MESFPFAVRRRYVERARVGGERDTRQDQTTAEPSPGLPVIVAAIERLLGGIKTIAAATE